MNNELYHYEPSLLDALRDVEAAAMSIRQVAAFALLSRPNRSLPRTACGDDSLIAHFEESPEGWLCLTLPVMLPHRKEGDKALFLLEPIRDAVDVFYGDRPRPHFDRCVLAYEHIYAVGTQRRHVTDHDNLELKHCQDLLESLFLTNDSAHYCAAFQCSHAGSSHATHIWILTPEQFPEWLKTHEIYWKSTPKI